MWRAWVAVMLLASMGARSARAEPGVATDKEAQILIQRMLAEDVKPDVCELIGRCTEGLPVVALMNREQAKGILRAVLRQDVEARRETLSESALEARVLDEVNRVLAFYVPLYDTIVVVREHLEYLLKRVGAKPTQVNPLLQCVLAHEYTHTVQLAHLPYLPTDEARQSQAMLIEGYANHVGARLCRRWYRDDSLQLLSDRVQGLARAFHNTDDDRRRSYRDARHWFDAYVREHGTEAAWSAQSKPPIDADGMDRWLRTAEASDFPSPDALTAAMRPWVESRPAWPIASRELLRAMDFDGPWVPERRTRSGPVRARDVLESAASQGPIESLEDLYVRGGRRVPMGDVPRSTSGWAVWNLHLRGGLPASGSAAVVLRFEDATQADRMLDARWRHAERQARERVFGRKKPRIWTRPIEVGADRAVRIKSSSWHEVWTRFGDTVVVLLSTEGLGYREVPTLVQRIEVASRAQEEAPAVED